ncbi:hypothetical protein [Alkalilimnicola sp. S0819]|nr:hypothetical protein [Alkalilimnicola sp. S0819]
MNRQNATALPRPWRRDEVLRKRCGAVHDAPLARWRVRPEQPGV